MRLGTDLHPSLVLLDITLPLLGGEAVAMRLRETPGGGPPVMLLSASADISRIARTVGAVGFLRKPFDLDDVLEIVNRVVRAPADLDR